MTSAYDFTLIALHGNGGGAFRFERVQPYIPANICFYPITLPGFAHTPRDPTLQSLRDYATYLRTVVAGEAHPLVLLGHGIGGTILLEFAQIYPAEVEALILHAPVGTRLETRLFPRLMKLPGLRSLGQHLFASPLTRPIFKRLLFTQPVPPAYLNRFFDEYRRCAVFGQTFDLITPEWFNTLHPIDTPAALLWGTRERILTVKQLDDYRALLSNPIVRIVSNWDHFPMIEQPAEYAAEIISLARKLIGYA